MVVLLIALLWNFVFIVPGSSGQEDIKTTPNELLLYALGNDRQVHVTGVFPVDPALTVHQKLGILLSEINRRYYSDGRSLEVLRTKKTRDGFIVTVDLRESGADFFRSKWYQAFQGLGADQTFVRIIYAALQPDSPGFWFTGVNLAWNGKPFDDEAREALDFGRLTGITYRREVKNIYS